MNIVEKARVFATAAHAAIDQKRKYTFEPYIKHPAEVVEILKLVPHTAEMLAAAWLHDVVEDTSISIEVIRMEFGKPVAELVTWLTDVSRLEHGNRAHRKALDRAHIADASADAQTIKLADSIANLRDIIQTDEKFAGTYKDEKRELLAVLNKGNPALQEMLFYLVQRT